MLRTFVDTTKVEAGRWGPPLVDLDWHAICQAIFKSVAGVAWENLCCKSVEMNKGVNVLNPGSQCP